MTTQKEISIHLDLSERRVRSLIKDGILPPSRGPGGNNLDDCRFAYIRYLRGVASGQVDIQEVEDEKEDYEKLVDEEKYRKIKRENDIEERSVIPFEEIGDLLENVARQIVSTLEALPLNIKRRVPLLKSKDIEYIKLEIAKCRSACAGIQVEE